VVNPNLQLLGTFPMMVNIIPQVEIGWMRQFQNKGYSMSQIAKKSLFLFDSNPVFF